MPKLDSDLTDAKLQIELGAHQAKKHLLVLSRL